MHCHRRNALGIWSSNFSRKRGSFCHSSTKAHSVRHIVRWREKIPKGFAGPGSACSTSYSLSQRVCRRRIISRRKSAYNNPTSTTKGPIAFATENLDAMQAWRWVRGNPKIARLTANLDVLTFSHKVQYLLILGQYLQGTQKSVQAWTTHGLAISVAYQLGLHSPHANQGFSSLECEIRKRTWFGCILLDRWETTL